MNQAQQDNANILFWRPIKPMGKTIPSEKQLTLWQDSKMYGVWIDGKRIENKNLADYNNADFSHWFSSKLSKNAINYGKHYVQVDLMTKSYYQDYYDKAIKNPKSMMVIRQGNLKSK